MSPGTFAPSALDPRVIKEVHISKFFKPPGNDAFYAEIEVLTDDRKLITSSPIVPLGNSTVSVSFSIPEHGPTLNAIITTE
jgi:hypothetical protein